jgi:ABC-type Fe3+-hydroxamate transport system substrate-binding protein
MEVTDQLNRTIFLPKPPTRIISLVPSQTELLVDLGLEDRILGVSKFCVHPKDLKSRKTIVGGTKNYRFDVIDSLSPDLIIGNKEENDQQGIEILASKYPVWLSDISSLEDNYRMIRQLGELTQTDASAEAIIQEIERAFVQEVPKRGTCVYLIWNDPIMVAGKNTFIDAMLERSGFENLILKSRYPSLLMDELVRLSPDFLLLSSEPFPFSREYLIFFQSLLPQTVIKLVDGEMFSWYGSRLKYAAEYFRTM